MVSRDSRLCPIVSQLRGTQRYTVLVRVNEDLQELIYAGWSQSPGQSWENGYCEFL